MNNLSTDALEDTLANLYWLRRQFNQMQRHMEIIQQALDQNVTKLQYLRGVKDGVTHKLPKASKIQRR